MLAGNQTSDLAITRAVSMLATRVGVGEVDMDLVINHARTLVTEIGLDPDSETGDQVGLLLVSLASMASSVTRAAANTAAKAGDASYGIDAARYILSAMGTEQAIVDRVWAPHDGVPTPVLGPDS